MHTIAKSERAAEYLLIHSYIMKFPCFAVWLSSCSMHSTVFKSTQFTLCELLGNTHFVPFHLSLAPSFSLSLYSWIYIRMVPHKLRAWKKIAFIHITLEDLVKIQMKTLFSIYIDGVIWMVMVENILWK